MKFSKSYIEAMVYDIHSFFAGRQFGSEKMTKLAPVEENRKKRPPHGVSFRCDCDFSGI